MPANWAADDGIGRGYLDGGGGGRLCSTALLFVKSWVMKGLKDSRVVE